MRNFLQTGPPGGQAPIHRALGSLTLCLMLCTGCQEAKSSPSTGEGPPKAETGSGGAQKAALPAEVTFNEHIQPILSEYCYHCHGPDEKTRYPEDLPLRLDLAEHAFEPRENGLPVIIKGDAENSLLVSLIRSRDKNEVMPPPESHKELKPEHIALLEQWVNDGAEYQEHWSFIPVSRPDPPNPGSEWALNPVDQFIEARMTAAGLEPNPVDSAGRFLRRLTFDLTGLPPTPEELDQFETAWRRSQDHAVQEAITRLMKSPAYGEHYGRHWLDAARYSDTHGIHIDNYRSIWPYRDWVVDAFNANMPFDQFTIEQIAGDLLPGATLEQVIATGFNRCLPTTGEGGAIAEEYDAIYAQDRTNTTTAVWLGLTSGCAACHDHKFDPISTADNYKFNAFFRNTTMGAMDRNEDDHPPNVFAPLKGDRERYTALKRQIGKADAAIAQRARDGEPDFQKWLNAPREDLSEIPAPPIPDFHLPLNQRDRTVRGGPPILPMEWPSQFEHRDGPLGPAPIVSGPPLVLGEHGRLSAESGFSYGATVYFEGKPTGALVSRMDSADNYRGWDLWLQNGRIGAHIVEQWDDRGSKSMTKKPLAEKTWHHVMVTFDPGRKPKDQIAIYLNGKKQEVIVEKANLPAKNNIATKAPLTLGSRHGGGRVTPYAALQDFRIYRRVLVEREIMNISDSASINAILAIAPDQLNPGQMKTLREFYFSSIDPATRELTTTREKLAREFGVLKKRGAISLIMKEKDKGEPFAHILIRGEYTKKGDKVGADVPEVLPGLPEDAPRNRLGLARWLVSPENPLSARVTTNRLWYYIFGRGIVETTEDFGIMGARPSHPKLLDWLATEFMESGWDQQHLLRVILSSATYRQSQDIPAHKLARDPLNILLSRSPRFRLEAEQIRDLALASSGLLVERVGGPPVKPYQPEGVWEAVAMKRSNTRFYEEDRGENLYRRSLYTFHKRTAPHPTMDILNAPTREVFCVRRERTNTPLQAFVTMNDVQFVEASRHLAEEVLTSTGNTRARLDLIYKRLLARAPKEGEYSVLEQSLESFLQAYQAAPEEAQKLITQGQSTPDETLPATELAAWTLLTSKVLNLDETLAK